MQDLTVLLTKLNPYPDRVKVTVDPVKKEKLEAELFKLFDDIVEAYHHGTLEERIDIDIVFEGKYSLLPILTRYVKRAAERARIADRRGNHKAAFKIIEQGIIADAIIAGRGIHTDLHLAQDQLVSASELIEYDVMSLLKELEIPPPAYAKRAHQFHKQDRRHSAIKALGRALQLNARLELNDQVIELAIDLTGQNAYNAIKIISDTYLQDKFLREIDMKTRTIEIAAIKEKEEKEHASNQIIAGIVGFVLLALGAFAMTFVATSLTNRVVQSFRGLNEIWLLIIGAFAALLILAGIYALVTRRLNLFFQRHSLRTSLKGAAAIVAGVGYIGAGLVWLLMFALEMQFIRSLGPINVPLSPENDLYAIFLGAGIWLVAIVAGLLINFVWGKSEIS